MLNSHIVRLQIFVEPHQPLVKVLGFEPNREGNWTQVQRTVFFHLKHPIFSLDFIATSKPPERAIPGSLPSEDIHYNRPSDIGEPPQRLRDQFIPKELPPTCMREVTLKDIIYINQGFRLPPQDHLETIYNGALSKLDSTVPLVLPHGPDVPTNSSERRVFMGVYSELLRSYNSQIANMSIKIHPQKPLMTVTGLEANKEGICTLVGRTFFFHQKCPIHSLDFIATSKPPVRAGVRGILPSRGVNFHRPPDIGPPPQH
jgi:hypothetical protein